MREVNLLPCPFCGGKANVEEFDDGSGGVLCSECGFHAAHSRELWEKWNQRREGWSHAIERATEAEAERCIGETECYFNLKNQIEQLQTENTKLRKVVEAASELVTQINNRTKTMGLDMSNYHAISITVKPGDAGRDYWEAVWAFEQALAELDKEGER